MRDAAKDARDAGTSLFFLGANAAYWRVALSSRARSRARRGA